MRNIILFLIAFALGWGAHYFLGSNIDILPRPVAKVVEPNVPQTSGGKLTGREYLVLYKGDKFEPSKITLPPHNYLTIRNDSDSLMWLSSDHPIYNTTRGYGESEQVKSRLSQTGTWTVKNKLRLDAVLVIEVRE